MKTKVFYTASDEAARIIKNGGLVAVPTETVYGLCANALDEKAVKKIFELKGRDEKKPMALMISGAEDIEKYALNIPAAALALAEKFWPGPLTIVLKAREFIPEIVKASSSTIGLRCPDKKITLELLKKCSLPLAGPSANPREKKAPFPQRKCWPTSTAKSMRLIDGGESELKEARRLSLLRRHHLR